MKIAELRHIDIVNGKPTVVKIVDYVYDELAKTGEYDLMVQGIENQRWNDLLAESKRLNDQWNGRA